jgi:hypothetical protein
MTFRPCHKEPAHLPFELGQSSLRAPQPICNEILLTTLDASSVKAAFDSSNKRTTRTACYCKSARPLFYVTENSLCLNGNIVKYPYSRDMRSLRLSIILARSARQARRLRLCLRATPVAAISAPSAPRMRSRLPQSRALRPFRGPLRHSLALRSQPIRADPTAILLVRPKPSTHRRTLSSSCQKSHPKQSLIPSSGPNRNLPFAPSVTFATDSPMTTKI